MRIPARFSPLVFGGILSAVMTAVVSAFVILVTQGATTHFLAQWLGSCAMTWPVAFPTVTVVAPLVRKVVANVTA
ncbi:MAG TPA: DUF2798 domain-containing protein [Steroidobacteraceae bacterium]|nr:DUF2798 domain-containing protein [Steroidobacteraceae bacterium]